MGEGRRGEGEKRRRRRSRRGKRGEGEGGVGGKEEEYTSISQNWLIPCGLK